MTPPDRTRLTSRLRDHVAKIAADLPARSRGLFGKPGEARAPGGGVIHNRQPQGPALWHLEGATLPLLKLLSGGAA